MSVPTIDFDWVLEHATAIAFDPGRPSLYIFALGMGPDELRTRVLMPMEAHGLFASAQTQYIDASRRERYKGQLPRIALTLFEVGGCQYGLILSDHPKFQSDLSQYMAWQSFWHQQCLEATRAATQS
jgi:hypothetical protein